MNDRTHNYRHLKPVLLLFTVLQLLLFAPRLNSDGAYYYEYLRSWVLQGDLNFHDEREFFTWEWIPVLEDFLPGDWDDTGYPPNIFSFGPAMIWMPFFLVSHWFILLLNVFGAGISTTGYGVLHRFLPMLASPLAGLATVFVLDRIGREAGFEPEDRAVGLFFFLGASHLPAFLFVTPAFAHAYSVLFVSLFVLIWYYSARIEFTWSHYALFGLVTGLAATARWQNLFCLILPLMDIVQKLCSKREWKTVKNLLLHWSVFGLALFLAVVPQLLVTRTLYGTWVTDPQGEGGMQWLNPRFRLILFDGIKGLFTVNPVLLPATLALPFLWKRNRRLTWGLTLLVLSQSCINAVRRDWAGVGFGMRRFLNLSPGFAIGLMVIFALSSKPSRRWLKTTFWSIGSLLIVWNLLLMGQYYYSRLGEPWVVMTTSDMVRAQFTSSPGHMAELIRTGLIVNGLMGDYAGLLLGVIAITIVASCAWYFKAVDLSVKTALTRTCVLLSVSFYLLLVTGWLVYLTGAAKTYHVPDIYSLGYFASAEKLRLNPASGFQGFRGGLIFGPENRRRIVQYKAEYDGTRFLASGEVAQHIRDHAFADSARWTFNEPVEADKVVLVSRLDNHDLEQSQQIGDIVLIDFRNDTYSFPIVFKENIASSDYIPENTSVLERRWPVLNPVETGISDTQTVLFIDEPILIRSVEIRFENLGAEWFVRGIAFGKPDRSPIPEGRTH